MSKFKVVEFHKMEGSVMLARTLGENLPWREANSPSYLSFQGKRSGKGTLNVMRQDDRNFVEVE